MRQLDTITRKGVVVDKAVDALGHWLKVRWGHAPVSWVPVSPEQYAQASLESEVERLEDVLEKEGAA